MARFRPAVLACALFAPVAAADPAEKGLLAVMAEARDLLAANRPAAAVEALERHLPFADGNRAYLDLLRSAYAAELKAPTDPKRAADLRTKLSLLGGPLPEPTPTPAPPPVPPGSAPNPAEVALGKAATIFKQASGQPSLYGEAAKLFAAAFLGKVQMRPEQMEAWAYCRIKVANDQLSRAGTDPKAASEVIAEVEDALALAPENAKLQKVGQEVIAAARQRGGVSPTRARPAPVPPSPAADGWEVVETPSFRVRHQGRRPLADAIARVAEARREEIFARWSGPPGGAWQPKCEVVLHPTASAFAAATQQPPAATGRAVVRLDDGRPVERRIDLRVDDETAADNALPRELTHVVLADLFPAAAPPRWAAEGMAVLAATPAELDRYRRTLVRCQQGKELVPVETLLGLKDPPADRVTGYYVGSVTLVDFLVRWKGEKAFTTFLRDGQRYGQMAALKRQYGFADGRQLEEAWLRSELGGARGQVP